jgi:hypothetical protein
MDKALLQYEMNKKGITTAIICEKLDMSRSAFYRKCNGKSEFTQKEIQAIIDLLQLDSPMAIFFAK